MKLIYKIIRVTHLTDGRVIENTVGEVTSEETQEVRVKAQEDYEEKLAELAEYYLPNSPYEYEPSQGIGYALKLEATEDELHRTYVIRTTYRRSQGLDVLMKIREEDLLDELANPRYPVDRFYLDGNSGISYCDWYDKLLGFYQINLLTMTHFGQVHREVLYMVGHRQLGEARKIALSLFNQEAEKFSIKNDIYSMSYEKEFHAIVLELRNHSGQFLEVEAKPAGIIGPDDQEEEMEIYHRENIPYNRNDATPSNVNHIEDLWSADHLTVYDYKVMNIKKYDLVRYVYDLRLIVQGGGRNFIDYIGEFTHHDLAIAKQAALDAYREKVKDLQGKYSPDILDTADATVTSYNYYLELSQVRGDYTIITEASFSYDGTDITQKDEEERIFDDLKRENPSSTFVNNRQKKDENVEQKRNEKKEVNDSDFRKFFENEEDEEDDGLPW